MTTQLTFLGAAQTVTGSKHLVSRDNYNVLIDCGLYQGEDEESKKRKDTINFPPDKIDAVVLTHSHLDHCGYLPKLVQDGFKGPIICTPLTRQIAPIILRDAAKIQLQELKDKREISKRHPNRFKALYYDSDVSFMLKSFRELSYERDMQLGPFTLRLHQAGHIPGAASAGLKWDGGGLIASGDLGRYDDPFTFDPVVDREYDNIILESTYGGETHSENKQIDELKEQILETKKNNGLLLIPAFSLARTQILLFLIKQSFDELNISMPVFMDSPMANQVTSVLSRFSEEYKGDLNELKENFKEWQMITEPWQNKAIENTDCPKIILSASGMLTGGKIMNHLLTFIENKKTILFLPGYQAKDTLGDKIASGTQEIEVQSTTLKVLAKVVHSHAFSAHADENELVRWVKELKTPIKNIYLVHGEVDKISKLKTRLVSEFDQTQVHIPELNQSFEIENSKGTKK